MIQNNFGGKMPTEVTVKSPFLANQEQSIRDLEIDPALFTPRDQMREWARMPPEMKINMADFLGGGQISKK